MKVADSAISTVLPKSEIPSILQSSVAVQEVCV